MKIPAMHARRVQSMIHLLIELYGNWEEDSETKWRYKSETKPKNKIGGTKTKSSCSIFLKRYTCCTSEPHPYLHGETGSYLMIATSHTRRVQYCSDSFHDEALQKLGVKRVRVSVGVGTEQDKA